MHKARFLSLALFTGLLCLVLFAPPLFAAFPIEKSAFINSVAVTINVPGDYTSIQEAIDAASDGDSVIVAPGEYSESLNFGGRLICVKSSDGPLATTITADDMTNLVVFNNDENEQAILEGFRLEGGNIAIWCEDAGPTIKHNILLNQNVRNWAAICLSGAGYGTFGKSPAIIINNTIMNSGNGGISSFSTVAPVIKNNIISFNDHYGIHRDNSPEVPDLDLSYNDVYGQLDNYQNIATPGTGSISLDPKLNPDMPLTADSPCRDTGDPDPEYNDPDGSRNDMGAVPFDNATIHDPMTIYVPDDFETLANAVYFSGDDDTILVSPGTYYGPIIIDGKNIIIQSTDGPLETIITGEDFNDLVTFQNIGQGLARLEGFSLSGGHIGIKCENAGPIIKGNLLTAQTIYNWAAISLGGPGYAVHGDSPAQIINNTITGCANGGISSFSVTAPTIKNNIIVFNGHYGIHRINSPAIPVPELSYNDVYGNPDDYQEIVDFGVGTISDDPLFTAEYRLREGSPCIDAGDPDPEYNDPDGSRNDMGAIPGAGGGPPMAQVIHVPADYPTIQQAVEAAQSGDTILVAPGVYKESIVASYKGLCIKSEAGADETIIKYPALEKSSRYAPDYDGFDANYEDRETGADKQAGGAVIELYGSYATPVTIDGFTIRSDYMAQGIHAENITLSVKNCTVEFCWGYYDGGGLFLNHTIANITNNKIRYNWAPISGAGVFSRPYMENTSVISGNDIYGNVSGNGPGISLIEGGNVLVERNLIHGNIATYGSTRRGALYMHAGNISAFNNTIDNNLVGITVLSSYNVNLRNNIVTNNLDCGLELLDDVGANTDVIYGYNDVWHNGLKNYVNASPGMSDISADPIFEPTWYEKYYLSAGSPCINTGDPDPEFNDPDDSRNDMGANPYEIVAPRQVQVYKVPLDLPGIQTAIDAAYSGDTIVVSSGEYREFINFGGKNINLVSESGPQTTLIRAPELGLISKSDKNWADTLKKSGDLSKRPEPWPSVVMLSMINPGAGLDGFGIDGNKEIRGIFGFGDNGYINNCIVENCQGYYDAGGMYLGYPGCIVSNNIVRNCATPITGAGIFLRLGTGFGKPTVTGNVVYGNLGGNGPGISLIQGNGAIVSYNIVYNNIAGDTSYRKGGIYFNAVEVEAFNNTVVNNGIGFTVLSSVDCDVRNNIIVGNNEGGFEWLEDVGASENVTYDYNDVWDNGEDYLYADPGANDISSDPLFDEDLSDEYVLTYGSPCINAGDPDPKYNDPDGSRNDIGARPYDHAGFLRGDVNGDGRVNLKDVIYLLLYRYLGGPEPPGGLEAGDIDCSGRINLMDILYLISYVILDHDLPDCN